MFFVKWFLAKWLFRIVVIGIVLWAFFHFLYS